MPKEVCVLTWVKSESDSLNPAVKALQDALVNAGGRVLMPILQGEALIWGSSQIGMEATWDICVTVHKSIEDWRRAVVTPDYQTAKLSAQHVMVHGGHRYKIIADWIMPHVIGVGKFFRTRVGGKVDYETQGNSDALNLLIRGSAERASMPEFKAKHAEDVDKPIVWVNLIKNATTPEGKKADSLYHSKFLPLAQTVGVCGMHIGDYVSLEKGAGGEEFSFDAFAIMYYPSRSLWYKMVNCEFMKEAMELKMAGLDDTHAMIALPIEDIQAPYKSRFS